MDVTKEQFASAARALLNAGIGYAAGKGYFGPDVAAALMVVGTVAGSLVWSFIENKLLVKKVAVAAVASGIALSEKEPAATAGQIVAGWALGAIAVAMLVGVLAPLSGCSTTGGATTPQSQVDTVRRTVTVAESAALIYASFPLCGPGVSNPCSDPKVVVQLNAANKAAKAALKAADDAVKAGAPDVDVLLSAALAAATSYNASAQAAKP